MSGAAMGSATPWVSLSGGPGSHASLAAQRQARVWQLPDARRILQLALAGLWLLDAVLQMQPYMFSPSFGRLMLASTSAGNPGAIAHSIIWAGHQISGHAGLVNGIFFIVQVLIALAIAARPTVKVGLAASIVWAAGVWWFGEGFGELLTGRASPLTGAPGAVLIYVLLAVLLWPSDRARSTGRFPAAWAVGAGAARAVWFVLWAGMAALVLQPANRAPNGTTYLLHSTAAGEPEWLVRLDGHLSSGLSGHGLAASIVLAAVFAVIALGVFWSPWVRPALVAAIVVGGVIWVVGEAFGGILTGTATDPNSGPLLALLAVAYWPLRPASASGAEQAAS